MSPMKRTREAHLDKLLTTIAREQLDIPTLECRNSDSLDFHDLAVWKLRAALDAAYLAGAAAAAKAEQR